jgi:hypothetical protein
MGTTPAGYVHALIDAANMSFDEILAPVRKGVRDAGITEDEIDLAVTKARKNNR